MLLELYGTSCIAMPILHDEEPYDVACSIKFLFNFFYFLLCFGTIMLF
jgi:hypothetical protein